MGKDSPRPISTGYLCLAHRNTELGYNASALPAFTARFKHALLFTRKVALADHMVVNTPNFREAYNRYTDFREICRSGLIEVAHFDKHKEGPHFTLQELKEFYRDANGFHPKLHPRFRGKGCDPDLNSIQCDVPARTMMNSVTRDPLFTKLAYKALEDDLLEDALGDAYAAYKVAYRHMLKEYPTLGIIHFDAEHTFSKDRNIFDYMSDLSSVRASRGTLVKRYGKPVARVHRALLIKVEKELLDAHAVMPPDLSAQRTIVLQSANREEIFKQKPELVRIPLNVGAIDIGTLASLDLKGIVDLRDSNEGGRYLQMLDDLEDGRAHFQEVVNATKGYTDHINMTLTKTARRSLGKTKGYLEVVQGVVGNDDVRGLAVATVITITGIISNGLFSVIPTGAAVISETIKRIDARFHRVIEERPIVDHVKSGIDYNKASEYLLQYD
jgi:hypothetical protein